MYRRTKECWTLPSSSFVRSYSEHSQRFVPFILLHCKLAWQALGCEVVELDGWLAGRSVGSSSCMDVSQSVARLLLLLDRELLWGIGGFVWGRTTTYNEDIQWVSVAWFQHGLRSFVRMYVHRVVVRSFVHSFSNSGCGWRFAAALWKEPLEKQQQQVCTKVYYVICMYDGLHWMDGTYIHTYIHIWV